MNDYTFGNLLYELRTKQKLSQFQLGRILGVSDKAVSKWENGTSKPKADIIVKLSKIFNISIDELFSTQSNDNYRDIFYNNKALLADLYADLASRYGNNPPFLIYNRFLSEYYAFLTTNHEAIKYLYLLKSIKEELDKDREFFKAEGFINSLFIPYIMGITYINPLPAHYYCPNCKKVEFYNELYTGWDLPQKSCDCGMAMERNGHNIPFESCNQMHLNCSGNHYKLLVSKNSIYKVIDIINNFGEERMTMVNDDNASYPYIFVNGNVTDYENGKSIIRKPLTTTISIRTSKVADELSSVIKKTEIRFDKINYDNKCLEYIWEHTKNENTKNIIKQTNATTFGHLIKIMGVLRNTYTENSTSNLSSKMLLPYREDVFDYLKLRSNNSSIGFALELMYRISRGRFSTEIPANIIANLTEINAEEWFINTIQDIVFLHSKTYGVSQAQYELTNAWININFPNISKEL